MLGMNEMASPDDRDAFEQQQAAHQAIEDKARDLAMMALTVLTTGRGPELLDYLRQRTVDLPVACDPQLSLEAPGVPTNPAEWVFIREGQNGVVRHLEGLIRMAREYAKQPAQAPQQGTE